MLCANEMQGCTRVLQYVVAVKKCCSVLRQCCSVLWQLTSVAVCCGSAVQRVAVCVAVFACSALQCVEALQCVLQRVFSKQRVAVCDVLCCL